MLAKRQRLGRILLGVMIPLGLSCSGPGPVQSDLSDQSGVPLDTVSHDGFLDSRNADGPGADADLEGPDSVGDAVVPFDPSKVAFPFLAPDSAWEESTYQSLSLRERIGQHIIVRIERTAEEPSAATKARIETFKIGGAFVSPLTGIASGAPKTTARFLHEAQALSVSQHGIPLFVSTDQEGGVYASVCHFTGGTDSLPPMAIGMTNDPWVAFGQFDLMAREIKAMGFNMNFAPSLDTLTQPENGNLNTRPFGPDPFKNAQFGTAAVAAMQHNLILPTIKHFPGDGMTSGNTHHVFVANEMTRSELDATLFVPFKAALDAGATGVMTMPAQFTALDPQRSAITSRAITTGLLRQEWGFDGLVVTDDLGMKGAQIGLAEGQLVGVEALKAGADMLLYVETTDEALETLVTAIEAELGSGGLDEQEFATSTKRILRLKRQYGLFERLKYPDEEQIALVESQVAQPEDEALVLDYAQRAAVLWPAAELPETDGTAEADPVVPIPKGGILCIGPSPLLADPASGWSWLLEKGFCDLLKEQDPSATLVQFLLPFKPDGMAKQLESKLAEARVVVFATFQAYFSPDQVALMEWLAANKGARKLIHVVQGVPFDAIVTMGLADATLFLTGALPLSSKAGVNILFGKAVATGKMTYDLDALHGETR